MRISWNRAKRGLAGVWFTGAGIVFLLVLVQTFGDRFGGDATEAWQWLLPTIMPSLSLIVGVLAMDARNRSTAGTVDAFIYRLAIGVSLFYLFIVSLTILGQPFTPLTALELMKQSNLWLGPLQGLAAGFLGAFFVKAESS
jgi:hypothetical protein